MPDFRYPPPGLHPPQRPIASNTLVNQDANNMKFVGAITKELVSCKKFYDFVDDLEQDVVGNQQSRAMPRMRIETLSHIQIELGDKKIYALLDTGSQVTYMAKNLYHQIRQKLVIHKFPVSNTYITPAVGNKSTAVKRQIRVKFLVNDRFLISNFLIIPYLTTSVILGNDWFHRHGFIIVKISHLLNDHTLPL